MKKNNGVDKLIDHIDYTTDGRKNFSINRLQI